MAGAGEGVRALSFLSAVAFGLHLQQVIWCWGVAAGALVALAIFLYWPLFPNAWGAASRPIFYSRQFWWGALYAILRWREAYAPQHLGTASGSHFGLATLAKNGALMWLAFLGMVGLWALLSKRMYWSETFRLAGCGWEPLCSKHFWVYVCPSAAYGSGSYMLADE